MESHLHVVLTCADGQWTARIGEVAIPVHGYAFELAEDGTPLLGVTFAPGSVQIGDPPARPAAPEVSSWGDSAQPDPRAGIPGWQPETLGGQVAGRAELRTLAGRDVARLA